MFAEDIAFPAGREAVAFDVSGFFGVDLFGEGGSVFGIDEASGDFGEGGVAKPVGAIGEGEFHGFGDEVDAIGDGKGGDGEVLHDLEDLGDVDAAGAGGRHADDVVVSVADFDGGARFGLVGGEVGGGGDAAVGFHPGFGLLGEGAFVEPVEAVGGDGAVGFGEVGLDEGVAFVQGGAIGFEEDGG